jgi:hypothetical protein
MPALIWLVPAVAGIAGTLRDVFRGRRDLQYSGDLTAAGIAVTVVGGWQGRIGVPPGSGRSRWRSSGRSGPAGSCGPALAQCARGTERLL